MKAWAARYYRGLTLFLCFLIVLLSYFFLLSPLVSGGKAQARAKLDSARNLNAQLQARLSYLASLRERRNRLSDQEVNKLLGVLPEAPEISTLLSSFEYIARASSSVIDAVEFSLPEAKPGQNQEPGGVKIVEARIFVSSQGYQALKLFLANIAKSERIMDVVGLIYNPALKNYNMVARAYYQPEAERESANQSGLEQLEQLLQKTQYRDLRKFGPWPLPFEPKGKNNPFLNSSP